MNLCPVCYRPENQCEAKKRAEVWAESWSGIQSREDLAALAEEQSVERHMESRGER